MTTSTHYLRYAIAFCGIAALSVGVFLINSAQIINTSIPAYRIFAGIDIVLTVCLVTFVVLLYLFCRQQEEKENNLLAQNTTLRDAEQELRRVLQETKDQKKLIEHQLRDLQEARATDKAMLSSIGDGLVVTDEDTRIVFTNPKFQEMLGWTAQETLTHPVTAMMPMTYADGQLVPYEKRAHPIALFTGKKVSTSMEYYYQRKDGSTFPASITVTPIKVLNKTVGAIEIFRDVTHEKEIGEEKNSFVSIASHQLRTPLTSINWYLELLLSGEVGTLSRQQKNYMDEVYRGSRRLVTLVDDLLNVSRIESGQLRIVPEKKQIETLVQQVIHDVTPLARTSKAKIVYSGPKKPLPLLSIDPHLFDALVHNLLTNAIRYSPHDTDSTITVSVKQKKVLKSKNDPHLPKKGTYTIVSVADTGIGIPKEAEPHLFQKLFRAENALHAAPEGTGLGLYLVKMIVDQSGATLWYKTAEGKGTTFFVAFPSTGMQKKDGKRGLAQYE